MKVIFTLWVVLTFLMLAFSGTGGALFVGAVTLPFALILGRKASRRQKGADPDRTHERFARINQFDHERPLGRGEYHEMVKGLESLNEQAKALIGESRGAPRYSFEEMRNLADDLRWACDEIDDYRLTFRRTADRNAYRELMIQGQIRSAVLYAAADEQRSPAEFDTRMHPLKGRFQMTYRNAQGEESQWEVSALGLSAIGASRYLWLYSDKVIGVRHFRVDRILSIKDANSGAAAEGEEVADWLAQRAGIDSRTLMRD